MSTLLPMAAALLAPAAYGVACRLTGESLAATWVDEWRLRRTPLRDLDAGCARNARRSGLVVTLSSIPSRLPTLAPTLKSLLRQTSRPEEIRLCLPEFSVREQRPYEVPPWLAELSCVRLVRCTDEGPATKFLDTLRSLEPDQPAVVLDDDRVYHEGFLEAVAGAARAHPGEVVAAAGWSVPADLVDRPTTLAARLRRSPHVPLRANQLREPRRVDIVQGVHGYLVRPRFFDLAELGNFSAAPEAVRYVDDVWISAHAKVPCVVAPLRLPFTDYLPWEHRRHFVATSLGRTRNRADRDADRGNSVALRHFSGRWTRAGGSR